LSFECAALLEPVSVGIHALRKISIKDDDYVLICGAGLIGLFLAQYLSKKMKKDHITIIDRNEPKLEIAKEYGVNTINVSTQPHWQEEFVSMTGGGAHHALEVCGAVDTYRQSVGVVRNHGNVVWVGNIDGDLQFSRKEVSSIIRRELKIHGCWNASFTHKKHDDWHCALDVLRKMPDCQKLITGKPTLDEGELVFKKMHESKMNRKQKKDIFIKVMFNINQ